MGEVIYIDQAQASSMTTFKELIKLYERKDPVKFEEAISKNKARYSAGMDEILGRC